MQNVTMKDVAGFLFRNDGKNYAEAVVGAWQKVSGKESDVKENLQECGSGRAPGGWCGAIYAARLVADEDKKNQVTERFADAASSLLCSEIRSTRKLSCMACVELAASLLEENLQQAVV